MQQDYNYRLWGVAEPGSNASCAFKSADGSPLYYPGYQRSSSETTPACAGAPTDAGAARRTDTEGRQWGWENDAPCAYKPAGNATTANETTGTTAAAPTSPAPETATEAPPAPTATQLAATQAAQVAPPEAAAAAATGNASAGGATDCPIGAPTPDCQQEPCAAVRCADGYQCVDDYCACTAW
jgi:hypothetical protein